MAKEHPRLRGPLRSLMNAYRAIRYKLETFYIKPDPKIVLFASFGGQSYSDSPKALFEYMLRCGGFEDYTFVWGLKKNIPEHRKRFRRMRNTIKNSIDDSQKEIDAISDIEAETGINTEEGTPLDDFNGEKGTVFTATYINSLDNETDSSGELLHEERKVPRVVTVTYGGKKWRKYLARSGYWIFNFKVHDDLKPGKNQIFLQTWHGTPLKRLGYDLEHFDNLLNTTAGIKKRYGIEVKKFSYFVSPSPYATEKFKSAWRMDDFNKSDIILEEGYPRNDILFNYTQDMVDQIKIRRFGYFYLPYEKLIKKKTIVLYAPTYRSDQHTTGVGYTYKEEIDFEKMRQELGEDFIILFRAHYFVANKFNFNKYKGFVYNVSKVEDINDLYIISDMLVTDYSSSMFDYGNLKRPMIFYMYDLEHYRDKSNGFYFDPEEELPGPIVRTDEELIAAIKDLSVNFSYDEKYRRFNEKFNPLDDGHVCERVIKRVFGGRENE